MSINNQNSFFNPLNNTNISENISEFIGPTGLSSGIVNMQGNRIINGSPGVAATDFATISQVTAGGGGNFNTPSAVPLNMSNHQINFVANGTSANDAVNYSQILNIPISSISGLNARLNDLWLCNLRSTLLV